MTQAEKLATSVSSVMPEVLRVAIADLTETIEQRATLDDRAKKLRAVIFSACRVTGKDVPAMVQDDQWLELAPLKRAKRKAGWGG